MRRTYYRPVGLVHGPDARRIIKEGRGASLGGLSSIAFTMVEVIERDGDRIERRLENFSPAHQKLWPIPQSFADGDQRIWEPGRPLIMGIVNVTPDSFSDGGRSADADRAITHGLQLVKEGADIVDVGGESTRPGSEGVPADEELRRVIPVIEALAREGLRVSCDTRKAQVMEAALSAGASIVNDVSALTHDPDALGFLAGTKCPVILMHAQGDPKTMQLSPAYGDVALDVFDTLDGRIAACLQAGIDRARIIADPGIGFGKTFRHNLDVLQQFTLYHGLGVPLLMGLSRKGFIGALTGEKAAGNRIHGSVGGAVWAALNGAHILRVHDVKGTVEALAVALAAADPENSGL